MKIVSIPAKTVAAPVEWVITRLDAHVLAIVVATITVFYQIESTQGKLPVAGLFALVPGVMWLLGAKFVANRRNSVGPESAPPDRPHQ